MIHDVTGSVSDVPNKYYQLEGLRLAAAVLSNVSVKYKDDLIVFFS